MKDERNKNERAKRIGWVSILVDEPSAANSRLFIASMIVFVKARLPENAASVAHHWTSVQLTRNRPPGGNLQHHQHLVLTVLLLVRIYRGVDHRAQAARGEVSEAKKLRIMLV